MSPAFATGLSPVTRGEEASVGTDGPPWTLPAANEQPLADRVRLALSQSGYLVLAGVSVTVDDGTMTLRGNVPTYFLKQVAQEVARAACNVKSLSNRLTVKAVATSAE